jgi:hypothetical protein
LKSIELISLLITSSDAIIAATYQAFASTFTTNSDFDRFVDFGRRNSRIEYC